MRNGSDSAEFNLPQLALRLKSGDVEALRELIGLYGTRLKAFCRVIVGSSEAAEDIVQEVFLKAWERREQLRDPSKLEAWLFTLARHRAIRHTQSATFQREVVWEPEVFTTIDAANPAPDARDTYLREEATHHLHEALGKLDPKKRDLLSLRYFSQLSFAEIAEVLDMPIGSVGTLINRSLGYLKEHLGRSGLKKEDLLP